VRKLQRELYGDSLKWTYLLTNLITWWCRIFLEKLIVTQFVKEQLLSLWNSKAHYRVHKSPPPDPILIQQNQVRLIDPYLPKVYLNVIFLPTPTSSQWPPNQYPVNTSPLLHACHISRPPQPHWFNHPNNIRSIIQAKKFIIMQFSPWSIFLPFSSKYLPPHSVLRNPQSVFLPQSERPSFAPIQNIW
jgi:hypothetical protein